MTWFTNFLYSQLLVTLPYPTKDFTGQTIIITGANTGLGFEAAKHFIRLNASKVILAVRSLEKGHLAKESILTTCPSTPETALEVWALDLSSYDSVKAFGERVQEMKRLDAVLENAGIGTGIWKEVEGNESTITVNVISTELLAFLVLPKLRETAVKYNVHPRLSIVASDLHFVVKFPERNEEDIFGKLNVSDGTGKMNMMER
jgi:NAD(P)-dependent dehydrogenase (short-subunit alcohol dehydrogenase family)